MRPAVSALTAGLALAAAAGASGLVAQPPTANVDWQVYGGGPAGQRYSQLRQITRDNVAGLTEAWRYDAGSGGLQTSPIVVGGVLYAHAADQAVIALDAASGRLKWRFASGVAGFQPARGLSYWQEGDERRLFASSSHYLYALDPATGAAVPGFGSGGRIDLRENLGRDPQSLGVFLTTPGIIFRDLLITGFRTGEGQPAAPGVIRAFDVRSGKLRWRFNLIPGKGEPGADSWPDGASQTAGGANNWAGMALDVERGMVYVPTGSAVPDFYGTDRTGDNRYANSLVALDAATGKLRWHFQVVHHDIWDRDLATPPSLLTVKRGGRSVDAVVQATKQGHLFVFDRTTGAPLFPVIERKVPASDVPGERASATQPIPTIPPPLTRQVLTHDMLTRRSPAAHAAALARFTELRGGSPFVPLGPGRRTVVMPGFDGGASWGGGAVDPARGILFINANDAPSLGGLAVTAAASGPGESIYNAQCLACHGVGGKGVPPDFPSMIGVGQRLSRQQIAQAIVAGKGRMPGFPQIPAPDREKLIDHLYAMQPPAPDGFADYRQLPRPMLEEFQKLGGERNEPYLFTGYEKFRDPEGYPAVVPPWGTLNAVDLNTGKYLWKVPLGEYPALLAAGMKPTGSENYGGPVLTASDLLFIGATVFDRKFRAFDARTGQLLWQTVLPYAGTATPITYAVNGRQYVVIAASGARDPKGPQGSAYVAFALPD